MLRFAHTAAALITTIVLAQPGLGCPPDKSSPPSAAPQAPPPPEMVTAPDRPNDPRFGLLTPIPDHGGVPPIVDQLLAGPTDEELAIRAKMRDYRQQLRKLRHDYFGVVKVADIRAKGIAELHEFTDPAAFIPMIDVLAHEDDDVRLAMLNHFAAHGEQGQAALARVAVYDENEAIRHEASMRLTTPASSPVLHVLDMALRDPKHTVANNAGMLAGQLDALQTIPLLIFAQATADQPTNQGDLAWIAIQTQQAFVARLEPVVGDNSGAFQPIIGVVSSGVVLRVVDAVVINYRTDIHDSLVSMTSEDWGQPTEQLAYDMKAWWHWYNETYLPYKNEQARLAALAAGLTPITPADAAQPLESAPPTGTP